MAKFHKQLLQERKFIEILRDKLKALSNAQLKVDGLKSANPYDTAKNKKNNKNNKKPRRTSRKSSSFLETEIDLMLKSININPHMQPIDTPKTTREESWMIRFDWDGIFRQPNDNDYSEAYIQARQKVLQHQLLKEKYKCNEIENYKAADYNLDLCPIWKKMKGFKNLYSQRRRICSQLAKQHIPPEIVKNMNFYDIESVLYDWSHEHPDKNGHAAKLFEATRSQNLKMFDACYGADFERIMLMLGYKHDKVKKMRQQMREGHCDDLFNVHHFVNVSKAHEMQDISKINSFNNNVLTFIEPHHRILHFKNGYDLKKGVVFFGGFSPLYQITRDERRERLYIQSQNKFSKVKNNDRNNR